MKLTTTARHFEATPDLIEYTENKLRRLKRFFDQILHVDVIMSIEKFRHIVEINVHVNGHSFAAKEESDDMHTSVDRAVKDLERQVKKFKGKLILNSHKHRKGEVKAETREKIIGSGSVGAVTGLEIVEELSRDVSELTVEEAIVHMEDAEHGFYLFNNRETGLLNLVYKRPDGNYGLIEKF
jgi:ribosome hibernation promoting factor